MIEVEVLRTYFMIFLFTSYIFRKSLRRAVENIFFYIDSKISRNIDNLQSDSEEEYCSDTDTESEDVDNLHFNCRVDIMVDNIIEPTYVKLRILGDEVLLKNIKDNFNITPKKEIDSFYESISEKEFIKKFDIVVTNNQNQGQEDDSTRNKFLEGLIDNFNDKIPEDVKNNPLYSMCHLVTKNLASQIDEEVTKMDEKEKEKLIERKKLMKDCQKFIRNGKEIYEWEKTFKFENENDKRI